MKRTALALTLILALLFSAATETLFTKAVSAKTLTVPDNYSTIQAAMGNATAGDTVFVKNGIYYSDKNTLIVIDKTLSLIGEDPKNTIIYGLFSIHSPESTAAIRGAAPNVTIPDLTITSYHTGIAIANYYEEAYPSGCRIIDNNIENNSEGIRAQRSDLLFSGNKRARALNQGGILGYDAENIIITRNSITENGCGINIGQSRNITVNGNNISNNSRGLNLVWWGPYFVYGNNITKNDWGIRFAEGCKRAR